MSEALVRRVADLLTEARSGTQATGRRFEPRSPSKNLVDESIARRLSVLERASAALETDSAQAALEILDETEPVNGPRAPTIEWGTELFRSACDIEAGNFERAADVLSRLVLVADKLPYAAWEYGKVILARAYGLLGRHEDELTLLAEVMQNPSPDPHDLSLAHEQLATCLDRYCLDTLAWEQWQLGLRSLPTSATSAYVRQLAGIVRSGLNQEGAKPAGLDDYVRELESSIDAPSVWPASRGDAGVALGQWHASQGDWDTVDEYCLAYGPLVRQHFHAAHPVAINSLTLEADVLVARGRQQEAIDLLDVVELDRAPERSAEALLRTLVSAQRTCGQWSGVARTNERIDSFVLATRKNRRRVAYHTQLRHIAELEASEFAMMEALSERDGLVTIVGHELRSPLAQIGLELDRCRLVRSDGSLREPEIVIRSYEQLRSIVESVSLVGLIESSSVEVRRETVDLLAPIGRAVESVAEEAEQVIVWNQPKEPLWWTTDAGWVERIVACLLTSALESYGQRGVVTVDVATSEVKLEVVVHNSGPLLTDSAAPGQQTIGATLGSVAADGGLSMGLDWYLAKRLAWLLGGVIEAKAPGSATGVTCSLSLPKQPSLGY